LILRSHVLMERYLGNPAPRPADFRPLSPVESVDSLSPPTLVFQGGQDVLVSPRHLNRLEARLQAVGVSYFAADLPWATHAYDYIFSGPGSQISLYFLERFLAEVTR